MRVLSDRKHREVAQSVVSSHLTDFADRNISSQDLSNFDIDEVGRMNRLSSRKEPILDHLSRCRS